MILRNKNTIKYFVCSIICAIISTFITFKTQNSISGDGFKLMLLLLNKVVSIIGMACMTVAFIILLDTSNKKN